MTTLALVFAMLSLLAFGGGNAVLPELQREMVDVHHWMSAAEFGALFGLAQAAPGPNLMVMTLLGWHLAGARGALIATVAGFAPSSALTVVVLRLWDRYHAHAWRRRVQLGLVPLTTGLVAAGAAVMVWSTDSSVMLGIVTLLVAVVSTARRLSPLWLLGAGAVAGIVLG